MTRLLVLAAVASLLAAGATAVAASRAMQPRLVITRTTVTATTEDLRPLLDASIAAAHQAADICREVP